MDSWFKQSSRILCGQEGMPDQRTPNVYEEIWVINGLYFKEKLIANRNLNTRRRAWLRLNGIFTLG